MPSVSSKEDVSLHTPRTRDVEQSRERQKANGPKSQTMAQAYKSALFNNLHELALLEVGGDMLYSYDKNGQHSTNLYPTQRMKSLDKCKKANPSPATKEHLKD